LLDIGGHIVVDPAPVAASAARAAGDH